MNRLFNLTAAAVGLILLALPLGVVLFLIWRQDGRSPFYIADRAGLGGRPFRIVKARSMIVGADRSGVESTSMSDARITSVGHFVRRWKIDELTQLFNVLMGDMNLVGPRPNTLREVEQYTVAERELLSVRPGITDISSIVFSDEGEILLNELDPDKAYEELIRPWKGRLGLVYVRNASLALDLHLICLTIVAIFNKPRALVGVSRILHRLGADGELIRVAARQGPLVPSPLI